ncbi:unnamed protein product, partial [Iphiclides podalirius]
MVTLLSRVLERPVMAAYPAVAMVTARALLHTHTYLCACRQGNALWLGVGSTAGETGPATRDYGLCDVRSDRCALLFESEALNDSLK